MDPNLKKKGQVKGVPTGDTVVFQGPPNKQGVPLEKTIRLNGIRAPVLADIDRPDRKEEPYAFEAREFLRKKLIGKQVFFYTEHKIGDREYGRILVDDQDIGEALLAEGLATLNENASPAPVNLDKYRKAADKAESSSKGVHGEDQKVLTAKTRKVLPVENGANVVEKSKGKTVTGIVEEFRNGVFNIYVPELNSIIKFTLNSVVIPNLGYNASQDTRCFIDTNFLQREVELTLSGFEERSGYFVGSIKSKENPSYSLVRELLKNGYARLNNESYKYLEPVEHRASKQAQEEAQREKLRVWANFESTDRKTSSGTIDKEEEFAGRVVEAHSGDSITVENLKNGEQTRVYLANVRAPAIGNPKKGESPKPWAWEAKEFVRSQTVGKKIRVEVEFSKKIPLRQEEEGGPAEERDFVFVSIILPNEKNLSELLVGSGLANVNPPYRDESFTKYMKQLTEAEEEAKNKKAGIHSAKTPLNPAKFSDYGRQGMAQKSKQFFEFVKNEASLTGVVDAVLSGSLFKVRLDKQNCYILFSLGGIRTYSMEKNVPQYEKFAKEALKFSKDQVLQRDVEINLNSVTPKGVFQGALFVSRKNFAHTLIENGLAYVEAQAKHEQKYSVQYKAVERVAEEKKIGIWGAGIPVRSANTRAGFTVKPINETKVGTVIEVIAPEEFYIHSKDSKKALENIENELTKIKTSEAKLEQPVKKGIPCVAKFSEDGKWYRARIEKLLSPTRFGVVFTDYGNYDEVSYDDIRKISPGLLAVQPLAIKCALAFNQSADKRSATHEDSAERLRELIWEKEVTINFLYEDGATKYGLVYLTKTGNIKDSVNAKLIGEGLVRLSEDVTLTNDQLAVLREEDDKAKVKKAGGWKNNDFYEEEDDY